VSGVVHSFRFPLLEVYTENGRLVARSSDRGKCRLYYYFRKLLYEFRLDRPDKEDPDFVISCKCVGGLYGFSIELLNTGLNLVVKSGETTVFPDIQCYYGRVRWLLPRDLAFDRHTYLGGAPFYIRRPSLVHTRYRNNVWLKQASLLCQVLKDVGFRANTFYVDVDGVKVYFEFTSASRESKLPYANNRLDLRIGFIATEGKVQPANVKWLREYFDVIIPISGYSKRKLEEAGLETLDVVYHGVDLDTFKPLNVRKQYYFTYPVQRNSPRKFMDFYTFIRLIFGNCYFKDEFTYLTHPELVEVYNKSYCVLSLSGAEGFNVPLLEGMSCGLYVIASYCPVYEEFLPSECIVPHAYEVDIVFSREGYTFSNELFVPDMRRIIAKCREVVSKIESGEKLPNLRPYAEKFDYRKTYRKFLKILDEIVKERKTK